jgi:hypothetical protein
MARSEARWLGAKSRMPFWGNLGIVIVAGLATLGEARAQIVNVQPLVGRSDTPGWNGTVDGSADVRTGNTRLLVLGASAQVRFRTGPSVYFLLVRGELARRGGDELVERHFEHLRYRRNLWGPLFLETFVQYQVDAIRRLAVRAVAGMGPRVEIVHSGLFELAAGAQPMFEYERLADDGKLEAGEAISSARLSSYAQVLVTPMPGFKLAQTAYVQPRFDDPKDHRILHELEALFSVNKHLAFKMSLASLYDSRPPATVGGLDSTLKSTVQVSF